MEHGDGVIETRGELIKLNKTRGFICCVESSFFFFFWSSVSSKNVVSLMCLFIRDTLNFLLISFKSCLRLSSPPYFVSFHFRWCFFLGTLLVNLCAECLVILLRRTGIMIPRDGKWREKRANYWCQTSSHSASPLPQTLMMIIDVMIMFTHRHNDGVHRTHWAGGGLATEMTDWILLMCTVRAVDDDDAWRYERVSITHEINTFGGVLMPVRHGY